MKIITLLILILTAVGCAQNDEVAVSQITPNAGAVELSVDSQGCLITSNADYQVEYVAADKPAINHVWRYLDTNESYVIYARYDYDKQCYRESREIYSTEIFDNKPVLPTYELTPREFTGIFNHVGNGTYQFNGTVCADNTGNVHAFGVYWYVKINNQLIGAGILDTIKPQAAITNQTFFECGFRSSVLLNGIVPGNDYTFELTYTSDYGDVLSTQTLIMTAG